MNTKNPSIVSILREIFQTGLYKRSQGRIARQVTFAVLVVSMGLGLRELSNSLQGLGGEYRGALQYGIPVALFIIGGWLGWRLVNTQKFADFLIAVEAEMNKVSWPSRSELFRGAIVVLITILLLAFVLWVYDLLWKTILNWIFKLFGVV